MNFDMRDLGRMVRTVFSFVWVWWLLKWFWRSLKPYSSGDLKKDAAIWSAFQKAFAAVAAMPAIVGVTKALLKQEITGLGYAAIWGISLFAGMSVVATSRGLRSELLSEGYVARKAEVWSWLLLGCGAVAMAGAIVLPV